MLGGLAAFHFSICLPSQAQLAFHNLLQIEPPGVCQAFFDESDNSFLFDVAVYNAIIQCCSAQNP